MLTTEELGELKERYTAEEVPPCRVCGGQLTVQSMGGGQATEYACGSQTRGFEVPLADQDDPQKVRAYNEQWYDHYGRSKWTQYRSGDRRVLALIDDYEAVGRYADALAHGLSDAEAREEGWPQG
jgi:hypothetical protein